MGFDNIRRGTATQAGADLDKKAIVGEVIVAKESAFDPAMATSYGDSAAWTGDVLVVTGKLSGKYENVRFFGLLAKQLHRQTAEGDPVVLKVTSGKSSRPGASDWVGVTHEVTDAEFDQAVAAAKDSSGGRRKVTAF